MSSGGGGVEGGGGGGGAGAKKKEPKRQEQPIYVPPNRKAAPAPPSAAKPPPSANHKPPTPAQPKPDQPPPKGGGGAEAGKSKNKKKNKSKKKGGGGKEGEDGRPPGAQVSESASGGGSAGSGSKKRGSGGRESLREQGGREWDGRDRPPRPPSPAESLRSVASSVTSRGGRRRKGKSGRGRALPGPHENASFSHFGTAPPLAHDAGPRRGGGVGGGGGGRNGPPPRSERGLGSMEFRRSGHGPSPSSGWLRDASRTSLAHNPSPSSQDPRSQDPRFSPSSAQSMQSATLPRSYRANRPAGESNDVRMAQRVPSETSSRMGPPLQPPPSQDHRQSAQRQPSHDHPPSPSPSPPQPPESYCSDQPRATRTRQSSFMSEMDNANEMSLDDLLKSDLSSMQIDWSAEVEQELNRKMDEDKPTIPRSGPGIIQLPTSQGPARRQTQEPPARERQARPGPSRAQPPQPLHSQRLPQPSALQSAPRTASQSAAQPQPLVRPQQAVGGGGSAQRQPGLMEQRVPPRPQHPSLNPRGPRPEGSGRPEPLMGMPVQPPTLSAPQPAARPMDARAELLEVDMPALEAMSAQLKALHDDSLRSGRYDSSRINALRHNLLTRYREVILKDPFFTHENNLDSNMWTWGFYKTYEVLRSLMEGAESEEEHGHLKSQLFQLIQQGHEFFDSLLSEYEGFFGFCLPELVHDLLPSQDLSPVLPTDPVANAAHFPPLSAPHKAEAVRRTVGTKRVGQIGHILIVRRLVAPLRAARPTTTPPDSDFLRGDLLSPTPPPDRTSTPISFAHEESVEEAEGDGAGPARGPGSGGGPAAAASARGPGPSGPKDLSWHFTPELRSAVRTKALSYQSPGSKVKLAQMSCQRYLTFLGDLARYRSLVGRVSEFGKARAFYLKALQLAPSNGRPHNQLGIIAQYNNRRLEAVYHFLRALSVKHPFGSAKEAVKGTFEEVRMRVLGLQADLEAQLAEERKSLPTQAPGPAQPQPRRREVWFGGKDDGAEAPDAPPPATDAQRTLQILGQEPTSRLYPKLCLYYLDVVRMLVTKVGLEMVEKTGEGALVMLRELLRRENSPLTALSLLQLSSLALFAVHNAAGSSENSRVPDSGSKDTVSLQLTASLQMSLSLWALLLEVLSRELKSAQAVLAKPLPETVQRVLPALGLLSHWMSLPAVQKLYSQLSSLSGLETPQLECRVWEELACVANLLVEAEQLDPTFSTAAVQKAEAPRTQPVILPEDLCTASFFRTFEEKPRYYYVRESDDLAEVAARLRLNFVLAAAEFVEDSQGVLRYDDDKRFAAVAAEAEAAGPAAEARPAEVAEAPEASRSLSAEAPPGELGSVQQRLQQHRAEEERKAAAAREEDARTGLRIEVRPSILVPDTNAFVEHLSLLRAIISRSEPYAVAVPVVVLGELSGLAKDEEWVGSQARAALHLLHNPPPSANIQAVTSSGKRMRSLEFYHEESGPSDTKEINDDKILRAAKSLSSEVSGGSGSGSSGVGLGCGDGDSGERRDLRRQGLLLHRSVVLLTEDRALKIKALIDHIPVKTPPDFAAWAGLSSS